MWVSAFPMLEEIFLVCLFENVFCWKNFFLNCQGSHEWFWCNKVKRQSLHTFSVKLLPVTLFTSFTFPLVHGHAMSFQGTSPPSHQPLRKTHLSCISLGTNTPPWQLRPACSCSLPGAQDPQGRLAWAVEEKAKTKLTLLSLRSSCFCYKIHSWPMLTE